ncbi:MAG: sulfite exporter TauE/SafE family protein [Candidatus Omnitrophica bacterium]|nr:sulfite exporter TauE/SafE family protein [Candidatus Omnitrophota bacterium]
MANENISYIVALVAGILTYLSPCLLPMIPAFITYITGVSFADFKDESKRSEVRRKTIIHALLFITGFSLIFIALGLTATLLGKTLFHYQEFIRIAGGALIMLFGLQLAGILKINFFIKERKFSVATKSASYLSSFLIGVTFAAAWTPCAGPILGSILVLAGAKANVVMGAKLLTVYSIGIAIPFFITALLVNTFLEHMNKLQKILSVFNKIGGVFLVVVGFLMATNYLAVISDRVFSSFAK